MNRQCNLLHSGKKSKNPLIVFLLRIRCAKPSARRKHHHCKTKNISAESSQIGCRKHIFRLLLPAVFLASSLKAFRVLSNFFRRKDEKIQKAAS